MRVINDLLNIMTSAIVVLDHDLHILYMNQSAEVLLGQSVHRSLSHPFLQLIKSESFAEQLRLARGLREPHVIRECAVDLIGLENITIDCIVTPLLDNDQEGELLLELWRVDRQLRIVREKQLLTQQQAIHEMIRGIAHEIKNPLGGLRGAAQLLESELPDPALKEYTQIIIAEADRLKQLVNNMLGPRKIPNVERVNIHEVLEHVRHLVSSDSTNEVTFELDYDPSIPDVMIDRGQLIQVCLNIVNNAVRATHYKGTVWLRTRVMRQFTIRQHRHRLVLRVDIGDDGEGIPEHLRDKLFLPMVSGYADGTGLGLSIAQSIMRQYSGVIHYESEPGKTWFSILIPYSNGKEKALCPKT
ncbi:MAG: nitrogen regulation protein NR(II) [Thiofilum sp.]|uniref:nitrogen regulation protein NR(II) n=1 Tax=Thiofilum sp. TaxID=2212733 RepID=UPI0026000C8D|nr:nitrogen regulation protein NR(II) [Thiofilum sp.]MBK8453127.1 PAS domain-containing protein [Thiofilum sp.]